MSRLHHSRTGSLVSGAPFRAANFYSSSAFASTTSFLGGGGRGTQYFRSRRLAEADVADHVPYHKTAGGKQALWISYWTFLLVLTVSLAGSVMIFLVMYWSVPQHKYCLVMNEQFDGTSLDMSKWTREVQLGGFGNQEFEWTTDSSTNSFVEDGKLWIVPTLTSDSIGADQVTSGSVNLGTSCTGLAASDCGISADGNTIVPPIQSARLTTNFSAAIRFGRVEVSLKTPTGDWLWPAVWMMPKDSVYGEWPRSGEIDIVESRGNAVTAWGQSLVNSIHSTLHFGPHRTLDRFENTTGTINRKRNYYNSAYTKFGLEWDNKGLYTWQGSRAKTVFSTKFAKPFWERGNFAGATYQGSPFSNPWATSNNTNAAPFDQEFYLILSLAAGGTNGYFPDSPNKPWSNNGIYPARDFWAAKDDWYSTWPSDPKKRGMSIEYVKMWRIAEPGEVCDS